MDADTGIGGPRHAFPPTRHSIVRAAKSDDASVREQAFDELIAVYWKPVYKYVRIKWQLSNEDAKDLTQDFFATAYEKTFFDSYDGAKSRFRTFLRVCVDRLVANNRKSAGRIKRGGGTQTLPLDFDEAENELRLIPTASVGNLEEFFEREWVRSLFTLAINDVREQCRETGKATHFALFERYDLEPSPDGRPSYAELAAEFRLPVTQVTNFLASVRSEFRRSVLDRLRRITSNEDEFRSEARRVLGIEPR